MSYYSVALEAKRSKDFDLAIKYYEKQGEEIGITPNLLTALGKIFYLKKESDKAAQFYIAAVHLSLHNDLQKLQNGDLSIANALNQISQEVRQQLPHEIAGLLLMDANSAKHFAHAIMDTEKTFIETPQLRWFSEIYYALILGDGSVGEICEKYNLSIEDLVAVEEKFHIPMGLQVLLEGVKWEEIDNPNVIPLYF